MEQRAEQQWSKKRLNDHKRCSRWTFSWRFLRKYLEVAQNRTCIVKGTWKMQDVEEKNERTTVWKRKKTEKKTTKKLRRKVFNSLRHLRSTKDVLFSDSLLFLIVETFETVVFPGQLVASWIFSEEQRLLWARAV